MFDYDKENCVATYTEKMITKIISKHDKETLQKDIITLRNLYYKEKGE